MWLVSPPGHPWLITQNTPKLRAWCTQHIMKTRRVSKVQQTAKHRRYNCLWYTKTSAGYHSNVMRTHTIAKSELRFKKAHVTFPPPPYGCIVWNLVKSQALSRWNSNSLWLKQSTRIHNWIRLCNWYLVSTIKQFLAAIKMWACKRGNWRTLTITWLPTDSLLYITHRAPSMLHFRDEQPFGPAR